MAKKTILLFNPKTEPNVTKPRSPPLSLLALAGPLLKVGYSVKIFDSIVDPDAQKKVIESLNDAICLGANVWIGYPITESLELSKKIKEIRPDFPIVWGSWHPSLFPEQTVGNPHVDIVVRGQGEVTFLELIKCLEKNISLENILGITYKSNGKIINNPDRPRTPLDDLPPFPFHLIDLEKYITNRLGKRTIGYNTSQGCPFNCAFCADATVYKRKRYDLSAKRVLKDMNLFIEKYNADAIWFDDTNFFINKKKLFDICRGIIKNNWKIKWMGSGKVNQFFTFSDEEFKLIKKSGCSLITVGAESGSQKILDLINKGIKVEDTIKFSKLCQKYDIAVNYDMMVGLPGETKEDFKQTIALIKKIYTAHENNELSLFFYSPYPGTPLYHKLIKEGKFRPPTSLIEWSKFDPNHIKTEWLSEEYKEEIRTFLFYLQLAFLKKDLKQRISKSRFKIPYLLMHKVAKFRYDHNFFGFPIERKLHKLYKKIFK